VNKIAQMSERERADVFAETAERKALAETIIEKDFWVCWTLKQLFSIDALAGRLLFKGGTSLSKIFHAINRFSEDIDLAVDYVALGFTGEKDPRKEELSKTKRAAILEEMMVACREYIGGECLEVVNERCEEILGAGGKWSLEVSKKDPNAVEFHYPPATTKSLPYIAPQVVLELGTHAEFVPIDLRALSPLKWQHINPYGTFILNMHERIPLGGPKFSSQGTWPKFRASLG